MTKPNALIITAAGINCDLELAHAFEAAGATSQRVHINSLIADPSLVERYQLIGLPGGFSFGDAVAAGRIMAQLIRKHLYSALVKAVERGVPIIAPCNGFQIAVQAGLLPGPGAKEGWPTEPATQVVTLAPNASSRFVDRWSRVEVPTNTTCIWTRGLSAADDVSMLPVAHGEGRFVAADDSMIEQLAAAGQIALRYTPDDNPNGSAHDIAGMCDASGLIFGLMPHPERFTRFSQHPFWTSLPMESRSGATLGLAMFERAVAFVTHGSASGATNLDVRPTSGGARRNSPIRLST
jgi:phosphoribosylformylglycinamidine synthase